MGLVLDLLWNIRSYPKKVRSPVVLEYSDARIMLSFMGFDARFCLHQVVNY